MIILGKRRGLPGPPGPTGPTGPRGPIGPQGELGPEFSLCDCCVTPMQNVLQQLEGEQLIIGTIADQPNVQPLLFMVRLNAVDDFLAYVTDEATNTDFVVSIASITAVSYLPGPIVELDPPVDYPGECDCKERPMREYLDTLAGSSVNIQVNQGSIALNYTIERTGLGIVLGELMIEAQVT